MKTIEKFFEDWNNKGVDFDGYYGFQCMDLYQQYNKECVDGIRVYANAYEMWSRYDKDKYIRIENLPDNVPLEGDVIIWNQNAGGGFGHIAVFSHGDAKTFTSFDQNWPTGSTCHFQPHNYLNVQGWLRPKMAPPVVEEVFQKVDLSSLDNATALHEVYGVMNISVLKSKIIAKDQKIADLLSKPVEAPQIAPQKPTGVYTNGIPENPNPDFISQIVDWVFKIFGMNGK